MRVLVLFVLLAVAAHAASTVRQPHRRIFLHRLKAQHSLDALPTATSFLSTSQRTRAHVTSTTTAHSSKAAAAIALRAGIDPDALISSDDGKQSIPSPALMNSDDSIDSDDGRTPLPQPAFEDDTNAPVELTNDPSIEFHTLGGGKHSGDESEEDRKSREYAARSPDDEFAHPAVPQFVNGRSFYDPKHQVSVVLDNSNLIQNPASLLPTLPDDLPDDSPSSDSEKEHLRKPPKHPPHEEAPEVTEGTPPSLPKTPPQLLVDRFIPARDHILKPSTAMKFDNAYTVMFWIKATGTQPDWSNIFHKGAENVQRNPGVWFYPGLTRLHIRSGQIKPTNNDWNDKWNSGLDPEKQLPLNEWVHIVFTHYPNKMEVYYNCEQIAERETERPPVPNEGPLYGSDPWHLPAKAEITNLLFMPSKPTQEDIQAVCKHPNVKGARSGDEEEQEKQEKEQKETAGSDVTGHGPVEPDAVSGGEQQS